MPRRVAVLMTCHNRRETTLASLRRVFQQQSLEYVQLTVFLVDDASTDGTAASVLSEFPQVQLLRGNGSLFWSGGMRWAFAEALKQNVDYYFWLNDDAALDDDALARMIATEQNLSSQGIDRAIVVGSFRDPDSGCLTYGGVVRSSRFHPMKFQLLAPSSEALPCHTFNGNAVLISKSVAGIAGNISPAFTHSMGDFDYGLRARKLGCSVWIAPGMVGTCGRNNAENTWRDPRLTLRERLPKMLTLKGLPLQEYRAFVRTHAGCFWPLFWILPYVRMTLESMLARGEVGGDTSKPSS